jgi:hypothetical protein
MIFFLSAVPTDEGLQRVFRTATDCLRPGGHVLVPMSVDVVVAVVIARSFCCCRACAGTDER